MHPTKNGTMKKIIICFLIVIVICGGCTQKNAVTGDYRNEANEAQYIVFTDVGTFTHNNFDNTYGHSKTGNFTINKDFLTLHYNDGQISEFYIDEYELIPVNENKSQSIDILRQKRYAKRLEQ